MQRFFMLLPRRFARASAAAEGEDGALYVLDMGEQIKLLDMARNLIRLSGFVPDDEIPIVFTGPRPGEKLYEELVEEGESLEPSGVDKILRVRVLPGSNTVAIGSGITALERCASRGDGRGVLQHLSALVPSFTPVGDEPLVEGPVDVPVVWPTDPIPPAAQPALAGGYVRESQFAQIPISLASSGFTRRIEKERE